MWSWSRSWFWFLNVFLVLVLVLVPKCVPGPGLGPGPPPSPPPDGPRVNRLQEVNVTLLPLDVCSRFYRGRIQSGMFCAGRAEGGVDACQVGVSTAGGLWEYGSGSG